jgi:hypothetical protein
VVAEKNKKNKKMWWRRKKTKKNFFFTIYLGNISLVYCLLITEKIASRFPTNSISTQQSKEQQKWQHLK